MAELGGIASGGATEEGEAGGEGHGRGKGKGGIDWYSGGWVGI